MVIEVTVEVVVAGVVVVAAVAMIDHARTIVHRPEIDRLVQNDPQPRRPGLLQVALMTDRSAHVETIDRVTIADDAMIDRVESDGRSGMTIVETNLVRVRRLSQRLPRRIALMISGREFMRHRSLRHRLKLVKNRKSHAARPRMPSLKLRERRMPLCAAIAEPRTVPSKMIWSGPMMTRMSDPLRPTASSKRRGFRLRKQRESLTRPFRNPTFVLWTKTMRHSGHVDDVAVVVVDRDPNRHPLRRTAMKGRRST